MKMTDKHYLGKPCIKCGSRQRWVKSTGCVNCHKVRSRLSRYGDTINMEKVNKRRALEERLAHKDEYDYN